MPTQNRTVLFTFLFLCSFSQFNHPTKRFRIQTKSNNGNCHSKHSSQKTCLLRFWCPVLVQAQITKQQHNSNSNSQICKHVAFRVVRPEPNALSCRNAKTGERMAHRRPVEQEKQTKHKWKGCEFLLHSRCSGSGRRTRRGESNEEGFRSSHNQLE